jgi:hypothetical protein
MSGYNGTQEASLSNIDILSNHYYPTKISTLTSDASAAATASKVFVVGEFDWTKNYNNGGTAPTFTVDTTTAEDGTKSGKIVVQGPSGDPSFVQIQQTGIGITSGHTYAFSFWAKSDTPNAQLTAVLQENHDAFTVYEIQTFTLSTSWAQYSFTNYTANTTDANTFIGFNLGAQAATIWIDLVNFADTASPSTNLVTNPSFETGSINPWFLNLVTSDDLPAFLAAIEANSSVSGDLFWDLWSHDDVSSWNIAPGDVYGMYYPGLTSDARTRSQALRTHAYKMQGVSPAPQAGAITSVPFITSAQLSGNSVSFQWQGIAGAYQYVLQKAKDFNGPWQTVSTTLTDWNSPFTDAGLLPYETWYRLAAVNYDGTSTGQYSPVVVVSSNAAYDYVAL